MEFRYFDSMLQAKKSYARILEPVCRNWDLPRNAVDVLLFLYNNPELDRAADIVRHRGIAKSHVSLSVTELESRHMLTRRYDPEDRRTVRLALTEQGQVVAREAREVQIRFFSAIFAGLTLEELELWKKITAKVSDNIENLEIL